MLTCIACSKQLNTKNGGSKEEDDRVLGTPRPKQTIKSLTSQIKDMAVKASGAYKRCKPCSGSSNRNRDSDAASPSGRFHYAYKRQGISGSSTPKILGKEMESRLKGLLSGEGTPESMSGRTESTVFMEEEEEDEVKEWVAQVEPGVLITFVSLPEGGNDLKRIRFSREMFDKWQAQKWWGENFEKVMELYNVQQLNQQSVPVPAPSRSKDESSSKNSPATPPLQKECPRGKSSLAHQPTTQTQSRHHRDSSGLATTPKLSSISGTKTETSSVDMSARSSGSSREEEGEEDDQSEEVSVSNASDMESEWVEQDEDGVYITIRALPDGTRELRRVRFSRERFGETNARLWWEQNRARIQQQYL
ncbi:PREDICTED: protein Brevis radix-like 2 [Brassica oleracea var. oleracea]|uniref:BRX domain-containing protein n=1 Tax=Brassica oleracea var. oleracea TaxID=109376 RepID=A0A0D3ADS8_BRAOL|nr:PREDICTED: protein Brevis radix-like 2 [Brassica oleracea var. oleracea]XP_013639555.1 PREDICTED: protein Brevis radix-like 2 [Brassica oleracea var. oleracea]